MRADSSSRSSSSIWPYDGRPMPIARRFFCASRESLPRLPPLFADCPVATLRIHCDIILLSSSPMIFSVGFLSASTILTTFFMFIWKFMKWCICSALSTRSCWVKSISPAMASNIPVRSSMQNFSRSQRFSTENLRRLTSPPSFSHIVPATSSIKSTTSLGFSFFFFLFFFFLGFFAPGFTGTGSSSFTAFFASACFFAAAMVSGVSGRGRPEEPLDDASFAAAGTSALSFVGFDPVVLGLSVGVRAVTSAHESASASTVSAVAVRNKRMLHQ
mmetsp:Transcript_162/g.630  ORF Transcript_162/g.630 Transcript_162/m.630 type:complete len:273 (-) Transcript_162:18-836(-)